MDEKIPKVGGDGGGGGDETIDVEEDVKAKDSNGDGVLLADQRGTVEVKDGEGSKFGGDNETIGNEVQLHPRAARATTNTDIRSQDASTSTHPPRFSASDDADIDMHMIPLPCIPMLPRPCPVVQVHIHNSIEVPGRDTNRLDYFSVAPFNLHGDDNLNGSSSYGGGGGGGGRTQQLATGNFANNDRRLACGFKSWWKKCWPRMICRRV